MIYGIYMVYMNGIDMLLASVIVIYNTATTRTSADLQKSDAYSDKLLVFIP